MITPRTEAALQAANLHIQATVAAAAERLLQSAKPSIAGPLTQTGARQLGNAAAQTDLQRNFAEFKRVFASLLREKVFGDVTPRTTARRTPDTSSWQSLSLVGDDEVDERVSTDRLSMQITHACEWELRELDGYMAALLHGGTPAPDRNPVRPEIIGMALRGAVHAISEAADQRRWLFEELGRALSTGMHPCYAAVIADLQARGVRPVAMAVKTVQGPGNDLPREVLRGNSAYQTSGFHTSARDQSQAEQMLATLFGISVPDAPPSVSGQRAASSSGHGSISAAGRLGEQVGAAGLRGSSTGGPMPSADAQMLQMLRRLNADANRGDISALLAAAGSAGAGAATGVAPGGAPPAEAGVSLSGLMAVNLIRQHSDELKRASGGTLDHMVIDVVGALFDQVLADDKVQPQVARQIARLQMPVLRAALKDASFFNSRRHPMRRFVNRIASLATAYEDLEQGPGREFMERVRSLVQEIVDSDFDQMDGYDAKLLEIEALIQQQSNRDVGTHAEAAAVLDGRETQLRIQQRYMRELTTRLEDVELPPFVRDFLAQVWSQVQVHAAGPSGSPEWVQRAHRAARELAVSVQPKGEPQLRKRFLMSLPQLMKDLNEGLALIRWPDTAKKDFFAQLLPRHADSLKTAPPTDFEQRQLKHRLEQLEKVAIPTADTLVTSPGAHLPAPEEHAAPLTFSPEEAQQVGLVEESAVDWNGQVDIDLDDAAATGEVDVVMDALAKDGATPTHGSQLIHHVQTGIAYRMHVEGRWQRVRLNWVSPGRAFFVFTHGKSHEKTISMTSRMLTRLCDTERFRAFEQAELIERATARARKQLASIGAPSRSGVNSTRQ